MTGADLWDHRYATEDYLYGTHPNDFLVSVADRLPLGRVLCIAEGEGRNATYLASLGHDVTAVDFSSTALAKATRLAQKRGTEIETRVADLAEYDYGTERWDTVVSIFCHLQPVVRQRVHRSIVESLKPGGLLVIEAYTPRQIDFRTGGPPSAELMVTLEGLKHELEGLEFVIGREIDRRVSEGSMHTGCSAVVQVLAAK